MRIKDSQVFLTKNNSVRGAFQKYAEKSHNFTSAASILLKFMDIIP